MSMSKNKKPNGYWTKERCHEEALKYETRIKFQKGSSAYSRAQKKGWLNDICSHMIEVQKPSGYWTKERCKEEAKKYEYRNEFSKGSVSAYNKARINGWLDEFFPKKEVIISVSNRKPNGYWNKERCHEEALKYKTRTEFQKGSGSAYLYARRNKWLDEVCSHMKEIHKTTIHKTKEYWTKERCKEEAKKYEYRTEFSKGSVSAYNKARINGWLDDICSHMKPKASLKKRYVYAYEFTKYNSVYVGLTWNISRRQANHRKSDKSPVFRYIKENSLSDDDYTFLIIGYYDMNIVGDIEHQNIEKYKEKGWNVLNRAKAGCLGSPNLYWTKKRCKEEALKYNTRNEFYKGNGSAYNSSIINGWIDDIATHMKVFSKPDGYWTLEKCKQEALKYKSRFKFQKESTGCYMTARRNGWLDDICSHMKRPLSHNFKWTLEKCKQEALKYKSRSDFQKKSSGCYMSARKNGWIDDICSHMIIPPPNRLIWTLEKCKEEALKYNTRGEFQKGSNAYNRARVNGWLNDICSHMKTPRPNKLKWTYERCKEEALKYNTRGEFYKGNGSAYTRAIRNYWLDDICTHMKDVKKPKGYWTYERCKKEALKYKTKKELGKGNCAVYSKAYKNGWIDEFFPKN